MSKRFDKSVSESDSRKRAGVTCRQAVLSLMRVAGYESDNAKWTRLLIENPIGREAANEAWALGQKQRHDACTRCNGTGWASLSICSCRSDIRR